MDGPQVRCPNCGALAAPDAEWCGQCWQLLSPRAEDIPAGEVRAPRPTPPAPTAPVPVTSSVLERSVEGLTWRCPSCGHANPIGETHCSSCGTPFAQLLRERVTPSSPPPVTPGAAVTRSIALPGLGHWSLGRRAEAVSRFVITAWLLGAALMILTAGASTPGPIVLAAVFLMAFIALWATSALDAFRIASGLDPLISPRTLLWASAAVVLVSVVLGAMLILPAGGGR